MAFVKIANEAFWIFSEYSSTNYSVRLSKNGKHFHFSNNDIEEYLKIFDIYRNYTDKNGLYLIFKIEVDRNTFVISDILFEHDKNHLAIFASHCSIFLFLKMLDHLKFKK